MARGDPSNTGLGAMKRDNEEADLFQLAENFQLRNLGDAPRSPRQDGWLGMGEVVDLPRTKGLMGMERPPQGLTGPAPSLCAIAPSPQLPFNAVGQYREPSPLAPFCPRSLWISSSHVTGTCQVDTGVPLPLRKD